MIERNLLRASSLFAMVLLFGACAASRAPAARKPLVPHPDFVRPPPDAQRLPSGVAYKIIRPGTGPSHPDAGSLVRVAYEGWRSDGSVFDSSQRHGKPQIFDLPQVVRGLSQGIQQMVEGEIAKFWIPASLAYGDAPDDPRIPAGPLVFQIELLKIVRP